MLIMYYIPECTEIAMKIRNLVIVLSCIQI